MTIRQRQIGRSRRRSFLQGEDRQQFLVTAVFVGLIVLLVLFLVGAVAVAYYNENIRSVARVGSVELGPAMVRERAALLRNRIQLEERRITPAVIEGEIDGVRAQQRLEELRNELSEVGIVAIEGLIDTVHQSQLASELGITVSEQEIDQRLAEELADLERRHVLAIYVEPEEADAETGPSLRERREARERAEQALTELEEGGDFADVAREYSTDATAAEGGDLGIVNPLAPVDAAWIDAVFRLPEGGTTPVIAGTDGTYRIGRVVEIRPRQEVPGTRTDLLRDLSEERYREFVAYELAAEKLREQIVSETADTPVDQVRLAHIYIEGSADSGDDEADEGEVHYSEIVYAPADDLEGAPDLPADDPAWEEARQAAEATLEELRAISDAEEMAERFAEIAIEESDSPVTAEDGGDAGFLTRGLLPTAVGDALFDSPRTEGELIGLVQAEAGFYVLLFHERRESGAQRLEAVQQALAQPNADFAALAAQYSDGENTEEGGELGWFTREMLNPTIAEEIFELSSGDVSEPLELGDGTYFFQALERADRTLDADQLGDVRENAFERWYAPRKDEAERSGVIVRADDIEGDVPDFDDFDEDLDGLDGGPDDEFLELPEDDEFFEPEE
ncbi:hypothetical protein BH24CHL6_BH24CHL6_17170 [soil metagenome]